ncbi:carboxypeptidase regulatory-like domain-containing protein [Luteibacter aegosomaticola]|uniref:TonB-dependent receptor n=1 Tax=Luteibacter aegosomaticola TaxID=2911538 RepID=UPI001FF78EBA|nr:carboxypeptidase regulatory-like domain-containing protein [Luteibacter aegosomaticola]UPG91483.1 carboxypeptidase regulatory-like domain-containing protein [Luteibacter aegosomaticola]
MQKRIRAKLLPLAIASLIAAPSAFAQETSSTISGRVLDSAGQPVSNATVTIVHEPSGTTKTTTTDANGRYSAQGLRPGGPFDVTANKDGVPSARQDQVYLSLGADTAVNLTSGAAANAADATALGAVTVSAVSGQFSSENKGLGTTISQAQLKATPAPSGNIADIARLDPRVNVDHGTGAISANGQNSRMNAIKVDGLGVGDPFGLNSTGMPTVGSPVSMDTLDSFNISTANYDVSSDTIGADINAVTKSGTNEFHGSVYYGFKNASSMVGDAGWINNGQDREYTEFDRNWKAGATVGGPIIKDKLFFFAGYEKEEVTGLSSGAVNGLDPSLAASNNNKVSSADLARTIANAQGLGIVPGTLGANAGTLTDKRYIAKIDWNITDGHRMNLAYSRTKEVKPNPQGNGASSIGLSSYWYTVNSDIKNYTLQSFDDWSDIFSSETKIGYSDYSLNRSVDTQQPMLTVRVNSGIGSAQGTGPTINLGEDQFSHYNSASVKTLNAMWAGTLYLDDHTIKGGFEWERNRIYNLFGRTEFGAYTFANGINSLANGAYSNYSLYQPAPGYSLNDIAAQWELRRHTFFLQDTWQPTDNLSVQFGFRVNKYLTDDKPLYNATFEQKYGFSNAATVNGSKLVEPRLSFNYTFDSEYKTQLRGGVGLFQSDPPTVWMTNPYQNNGINIVTYSYDRNADGTCRLGSQLSIACPAFSPDPLKQQTSGPGTQPQMAVDTVDKNFKLPSVWKSSIAFDRELPWMGIIGSIEYQHLDVQDGIFYQNLNIGGPTGQMPDGRFTYYGCIGGSTPIGAAANCATSNATGAALSTNRNRYRADGRFAQAVTYLTNTSKGGADTVTLSFTKPMENGWSWSVSATGGHATEVNPGTSSQASSNYSNSAWTNPNEDVASTANTNIAKRLNASITWQHAFFGDYNTTVSAFYDGHSGVPYSWVFGNDANGDSYSKDLAYIPTRNDGTAFRTANGASAASDALVNQFFDYIQHDPSLRKNQGKIARRNDAVSSWVNQIDLGLSQEIPGIFKGNKGEIRLDIYNFLNLLNKDWGQQSYVGFPYTRTLANFGGVDAQGNYIYNLPTDAQGNYAPGSKAVYDAPTDNSATKLNPVSRWSAQLTVRYTF